MSWRDVIRRMVENGTEGKIQTHHWADTFDVTEEDVNAVIAEARADALRDRPENPDVGQ